MKNFGFKELSMLEKSSIALAALAITALTTTLALRVGIESIYSEFIVGFSTWENQTKLQDFIVPPIAIFTMFSSSVFFFHQVNIQRSVFGETSSNDFSTQLIYWAIPAICVISSLFLSRSVDLSLLILSTVGIGFIGMSSVFSSAAQTKINFRDISLLLLTIFLIGLIPLEVILVLGRILDSSWTSNGFKYFVVASEVLFSFGLLLGIYAIFKFPEKIARLLPKLLLIAQLSVSSLFVTLFPVRLLQPNYELTQYETSIWLKFLLLVICLSTILDVISRYRRRTHKSDLCKLISPLSVFAILVGIKIGNTIPPSISVDDYHFGENLIGFWSYLGGAIPYVDYIPAHGLIDNDWNALISSIFFDGTAASFGEAGRLGYAILALIAFFSIYLHSRSIGIAFISIFFLSGRLSWLFLIPFICIWFNKDIRKNPTKWLFVWLASVPIIILGVPPQGILFVASSFVMASYYSWLAFQSPDKRWLTSIAILSISLIIISITTPIGSMFFGAIRYVIENGSINQVAYGIPWSNSWHEFESSGFLFEMIRMSWMALPFFCLMIIFFSSGDVEKRISSFYPAITILLFVLLLIPYSMGRIDPGNVSRTGLLAIFCWAILLPIIGSAVISFQNRWFLILTAATMSSLLNLSAFSILNIVSAVAPVQNANKLFDGSKMNLANIGHAYMEENHLARLLRLNSLLSSKLPPNQTYLDLTSRSAQYFYMDRKPPVSVTAPYNMVPISQQKRIVTDLSRNLPEIALLLGDNQKFDGGGVALRNPYLFRFVLENYTPAFEEGFIIGKRKPNKVIDNNLLNVAIRNYTDEHWRQGFHLARPAFVVDDSKLFPLINVGDEIQVGDSKRRIVKRIFKESNTVLLEGDPIVFPRNSIPRSVFLASTPQAIAEYNIDLFHRSFSLNDLREIPISWGNSEDALKRKMKLVANLNEIDPELFQIKSEGNLYWIQGRDPRVVIKFPSLFLSGGQAGLLKFNFECIDERATPKIQVFWSGDYYHHAVERNSVKFEAGNGPLIVPLDVTPRWVAREHITSIRIDLDNADACKGIKINGVGLYQRIF